jgi:predicted transcriptional regulator
MRRYSRRETEILEALYRLREASVGDVLAELDDPSTYDAVRRTLRILERKGAVQHREHGRRFVYTPTLPDNKAWRSTARRFADTFFGGSVGEAALAMLKLSDAQLSESELRQLEKRIARSKAASAKK